MQEKFLTIKDLMKITGIKSEATIRKMVARRQLPSGILLGPRRVWFESTIMETLKAWKKTATDNFLSNDGYIGAFVRVQVLGDGAAAPTGWTADTHGVTGLYWRPVTAGSHLFIDTPYFTTAELTAANLFEKGQKTASVDLYEARYFFPRNRIIPNTGSMPYAVMDGGVVKFTDGEWPAYVLTTDTTFQSGTTYYTKSGTTYTAAEVTEGAAIPADTYYVAGTGYLFYDENTTDLRGVSPVRMNSDKDHGGPTPGGGVWTIFGYPGYAGVYAADKMVAAGGQYGIRSTDFFEGALAQYDAGAGVIGWDGTTVIPYNGSTTASGTQVECNIYIKCANTERVAYGNHVWAQSNIRAYFNGPFDGSSEFLPTADGIFRTATDYYVASTSGFTRLYKGTANTATTYIAGTLIAQWHRFTPGSPVVVPLASSWTSTVRRSTTTTASARSCSTSTT